MSDLKVRAPLHAHDCCPTPELEKRPTRKAAATKQTFENRRSKDRPLHSAVTGVAVLKKWPGVVLLRRAGKIGGLA
jgi:hypothetical protein